MGTGCGPGSDTPGVYRRDASTAAKRLHSKGFHAAHGLDTWRTSVIEQGGDRSTVTALPGRHAPTPMRRLLPPVMGSMLEFSRTDGSDQRRLHICGDTLLIDELAEIPVHFDAIARASCISAALDFRRATSCRSA